MEEGPARRVLKYNAEWSIEVNLRLPPASRLFLRWHIYQPYRWERHIPPKRWLTLTDYMPL
jgi:hypothetical protein